MVTSCAGFRGLLGRAEVWAQVRLAKEISTRLLIECQLHAIQTGIRNVVNSTSHSEIPSIPRWYVIL